MVGGWLGDGRRMEERRENETVAGENAETDPADTPKSSKQGAQAQQRGSA